MEEKLKIIDKFEIIDHGVDHHQYFPGCGTAFSQFNYCVTGAGMNAQEAYEDAVEQVYQVLDTAAADELQLPDEMIDPGEETADPENEEEYYYVSIRF